MSTQKSGIATDVAKLSFINIFSMAISLLCTMLLSRYISAFEYGTYSQINVTTTLAISIFTLGLPNCINYFFARANEHKEKQFFLQNYFLLISVISLIAGLVLVLLLPFLTQYFHNNSLIKYTYVLLLLPLSRVIIQSNSNMLVVNHQSKKLVYYSLLHSVALLICVLAIPLFGISFQQYLLLYVIVQIIFSIYVYYYAWNIAKFSNFLEFWTSLRKPKFALIKSLLLFSIPLGLGNMINTLSLELDKLVIANLMDTESLAIYTNAAKELPITLLVASFTTVLLPKLSKLAKERQNDEIIKLWGLSIEIGFSLMLFFTSALVIFAPQVIVFLYSEKYLPGVNVFIICSLLLMLRSTYFGIVLNISGNTKFIFYSSLTSLVLNFLLNYLFFYLFGMIGPAISTVLSIASVNSLQLAFTSKILKTRIKDLFPWKSLGQIFLKNIVIAIPFIIGLKLFPLDTSTTDIAIAIILGTVWFGLYVLFNKKFLLQKWKSLNNYTI